MKGAPHPVAGAAPRPARRWKKMGVMAAVVAGFYLLHVLTYYYGWRMTGHHGSWQKAAALAGVYTATFVVGGGGLMWLARRFPLTRERWPAVVAANLLAVGGAIVLFTVFRVAAWPFTGNGANIDAGTGLPAVRAVFFTAARGLFPLFSLFLCAGHAWAYLARDGEAEVRRNRLHAELADARLRAVHFQLQPHLVFAAFHTLAGLMRTDPAAADRLLLQVASLMRAMLRRVDASLVPLRDEAAAIEALREVARATGTPNTPTALAIPAEAEWALVPPGVLQRLVDVAELLRGASVEDEPVRLWAAWSAAWLELRAATPCPAGTEDGAAVQKMERMRAQLAEIYGDEMSLALVRRERAAELRLQVPLLTSLPRGVEPDPRPLDRGPREIHAGVTRGSASAPGRETSA